MYRRTSGTVMVQFTKADTIPPGNNKRNSNLNEAQGVWSKMGMDALTTTLSALYGKLLAVMGVAFPMSEVISTHIPHSFYEVFYLYLYIGSMLFLLYIYLMLISSKSSMDESTSDVSKVGSISDEEDSDFDCNLQINNIVEDNIQQTVIVPNQNARKSVITIGNNASQLQYIQHIVPIQHFGSFYLRMGAVAFGIGSMIYSGLEIGQYFELERNTKCHNILVAITPATRMAFIFIQMYFIFLNEEQQIKVTRHKIFSKFGLMHMIGTNLSVWLSVLIQETKHEILTFYDPENNTIAFTKANHPFFHSFLEARENTTSVGNITDTFHNTTTLENSSHVRLTRSLNGPHNIYDCRRTNIIGSLVQNASPFLFPCTIEYSLICAAILYVVWKNIGLETVISCPVPSDALKQTSPTYPYYRRSPHHYSVDCAQAHKGLFVGILFLVLTIISLILFFVLVSKPELVQFAVMEVNICELFLYALSTLASIVGMIQVRNLKFNGMRNIELDIILLLGAQTGVFIYSTFTIIGGYFTKENGTALVLLTASISLIQTTCQSVFILDASRRVCATPDQMRRKPGREIITFLLVTNLSMWAINTLEKSRGDSHPIQLHFYGLWAWTIITHVSMPLAIFYRFHSTVCLCEIWKKTYKNRHIYH